MPARHTETCIDTSAFRFIRIPIINDHPAASCTPRKPNILRSKLGLLRLSPLYLIEMDFVRLSLGLLQTICIQSWAPHNVPPECAR